MKFLLNLSGKEAIGVKSKSPLLRDVAWNVPTE